VRLTNDAAAKRNGRERKIKNHSTDAVSPVSGIRNTKTTASRTIPVVYYIITRSEFTYLVRNSTATISYCNSVRRGVGGVFVPPPTHCTYGTQTWTSPFLHELRRFSSAAVYVQEIRSGNTHARTHTHPQRYLTHTHTLNVHTRARAKVCLTRTRRAKRIKSPIDNMRATATRRRGATWCRWFNRSSRNVRATFLINNDDNNNNMNYIEKLFARVFENACRQHSRGDGAERTRCKSVRFVVSAAARWWCPAGVTILAPVVDDETTMLYSTTVVVDGGYIICRGG